MTEIRGTAAQIMLQRRPLFGIQAGGYSRALAITYSLQSVLLKAFDPALNGASIVTKKIGNLRATVTARQKQKTVQSLLRLNIGKNPAAEPISARVAEASD